jgi:hypothetical protein
MVKMKNRILNAWKGKIVEVIMKDRDEINMARLKDFDNEGVYLTTDNLGDYDTLIDEGYYSWDKIITIRPFEEKGLNGYQKF